jgi:hypothetical protein
VFSKDAVRLIIRIFVARAIPATTPDFVFVFDVPIFFSASDIIPVISGLAIPILILILLR